MCFGSGSFFASIAPHGFGESPFTDPAKGIKLRLPNASQHRVLISGLAARVKTRGGACVAWFSLTSSDAVMSSTGTLPSSTRSPLDTCSISSNHPLQKTVSALPKRPKAPRIGVKGQLAPAKCPGRPRIWLDIMTRHGRGTAVSDHSQVEDGGSC